MIDISILQKLEPISTLSLNRLNELATLCFSEKVSKGINPFRMNVLKNFQAMYLLKGELCLHFRDGNKKILTGNTKDAIYPIDLVKTGLKDAIALSDIDILRIDLDLLDIVITWDELAKIELSEKNSHRSHPNIDENANLNRWIGGANDFGIGKLQSGVFSRLPSANIEEMFHRMTAIEVTAGQVIIQQGTVGDYYYLIDAGAAIVSRSVSPNEPTALLAELNVGDSFGEEALVSDNKRNASVTMKSAGRLLRLNKKDFIELLKAPLVNHISISEGKEKSKSGAIWLDVRSPSEYKLDHIEGAINIPLNQIRNSIAKLNMDVEYLVYCQTGRRSSACAFILTAYGFNISTLVGRYK